MLLAALAPQLSGRIIAKSIYGANGGLLLAAGSELSPLYIDRLLSLGIQRVYIADHQTHDIILNDVLTDGTRSKALQAMSRLAEEANSVAPKFIASTQGFLSEVVDSLILDVMTSPIMIAACADLKTYDDYIYQHSLNTAVIAIQMGIKGGLSSSKLRELGLGALLHDVGKLHIPKFILNKPARLSTEELNKMQSHTRLGWNIVGCIRTVGPVARAATLQHHERSDGSGYPKGLVGNDICWLARYVTVADVFDALTSDRPYRPALSNSAVLAEYLPINSPLFDADVLKALHSVAVAYPPGTQLQLRDGRNAIVIRVDEQDPRCPYIRIIGGDASSGVTFKCDESDIARATATALAVS